MNERKKELKEMYKQLKPEMGLLSISCNSNNKYLLLACNSTKNTKNSNLFQLKHGLHKNKELQNDWKKFGDANFTIEVLEKLDYDKDESKTDYSEELALLREIWIENLQKKDATFY